MLAVALLLALIALALPQERVDAVASALRRGLGPLVRVQQRAELARRALAGHDAEAWRADSLLLRAQEATVLEAENARLRDALALGARLRWGFVPGELVHPTGRGEAYTMLLTRGARDSVPPFAGVMAPGGVVGTVRTVDARTSVVLTWPHPDFRVSAMTADGDAAGIVAAHLGETADRFLLEFRGVPYRAALDSGALIVSSGAGGVFPRGVPVGTVLREIETSEGWARTYLLRPAVRPADVGPVMVLLPERVTLGVEEAYRAVTRANAPPPPPDTLPADSVATDSVATDSTRRASLPLADRAAPAGGVRR
jgi:rod shape-determining protein MreC